RAGTAARLAAADGVDGGAIDQLPSAYRKLRLRAGTDCGLVKVIVPRHGLAHRLRDEGSPDAWALPRPPSCIARPPSPRAWMEEGSPRCESAADAGSWTDATPTTLNPRRPRRGAATPSGPGNRRLSRVDGGSGARRLHRRRRSLDLPAEVHPDRVWRRD